MNSNNLFLFDNLMNGVHRCFSVCDNTVLFSFKIILFQALCYVTFQTVGVRVHTIRVGVWIITSYLIVNMDILGKMVCLGIFLKIFF